MPDILLYALVIILAYLLGSIPVGLFVVRAITGEDIRDVGSGRTGGTNAMRAAGLKAFVLTGVGDMLKAILAVNVARLLVGTNVAPLVEAFCAMAAVAGHNWSVFIGFRGGAGAMANIGAAMALWPLAGPIAVTVLLFVMIVTGYASVATTLSGVTVAIVFTIRHVVVGAPVAPFAYPVYSFVALALIAIALLPNYKRLFEGSERRVGPRAKAATNGSD
ncbi:MAG: glycerol-3-phosphate acyltransferase [Chloroflexi bacterium]|nr:glycerol-3-phosphate acyltransferase [Chloroflexota bacterium]